MALPRSLPAFLRGDYIDRPHADLALHLAHTRPAWAQRAHELVAIVGCLGLATTSTSLEWALLPLAATFLLRTPRLLPLWLHAGGQPAPLLVLLWLAWQAVSLTWSPDRTQGTDELAEFRWFLLWPLLFPVLRLRLALILAITLAFAAGVLTQFGDLAGQLIPALAPLDWPRDPTRLSGWWDPVVGGSLLAAMLGAALAVATAPAPTTAAARPPWLPRALAALLSLHFLVAVVLTGTRGAWLAAVGLVTLAAARCTLGFVRRARTHDRSTSHDRATPRPRAAAVLGAATAFILGGIGLWLVAAPALSHRVAEAHRELARMVAFRDFVDSTANRLLMLTKAGEAFLDRPLTGQGVGGFRTWAERDIARQQLNPATRPIHDHAHSAPLHIAATQGVVGLIFASVLVWLPLRDGVRLARAHGGPWSAWHWAPVGGLFGLLFASVFDCVQLNTQTAAIWCALSALCPTYLPVLRPRALNTGASVSTK